MKAADNLIIGGGVIGLSVAREIKRRWPEQSVVVLEKEDEVGRHASGRNSGVIHAGFYYAPDSLKAHLTSHGNRALREYCDEHSIAVNNCGKLVVTQNHDEVTILRQLFERGVANGVHLEMLNDHETRAIEPRARTVEAAIFSPDTAVIDPVKVMMSLADECEGLGIELVTGEQFVAARARTTTVVTTTSKRTIECSRLVNAAGLYADRIAHAFGVGLRYRVQPFKGLYLYADPAFGSLHTHVYPVPDLRNPFLGVHFTLGVDGQVKIGPTATPALWREQYGWREGFSFGEFAETTAGLARLMTARHSTVRESVPKEATKYVRRLLVAQAALIVDDVRPGDFRQWGRPGIRAQLVDTEDQTLVSDFVVETEGRTVHVLNAVSPAFTSSLPFASLVVDELAAID